MCDGKNYEAETFRDRTIRLFTIAAKIKWTAPFQIKNSNCNIGTTEQPLS